MIFPEYLYQLSKRDLQVTWLDPALRSVVTSVAAANVTSDFTIDNGRILVLTHVHGFVIPGGGQNVTLLSLLIVDPGGTLIRLVTDDTNQAADFRAESTWQGELIIPPGWTIRATADFNAALAANRVDLSLGGILIPVGNVQRL